MEHTQNQNNQVSGNSELEDFANKLLVTEDPATIPPAPKTNRQLYENSPLKALFDESVERGEIKVDPAQRFFNSKDPNLAIIHEKPEHRLVIFMKAKGSSNRDIAAASGYTEQWVSQILRQPWARTRLAEEIRVAGQDQIQTVLASAAIDSVHTLIELRDDKNTPASVRRASCVDLLDRYLGKPKQQVEVSHDPTSSKDLAELDREAEQLEKEINRLSGTLTE